MFARNRWTVWAAGLALLVPLAVAGCDREHPTGKEHPAEHPSGAAKRIALEDVAAAIEAYVKPQSGAIKIEDPASGKRLELALVKVHRDRLATLGNDVYFACADFKAPDGTLYDIDMFMKGAAPNALTFSEMAIHKVAGKERYTWYEEGGVWKKKTLEPAAPPAEKPKPAAEHPKGAEHPK
jgi:hypothetical protein